MDESTVPTGTTVRTNWLRFSWNRISGANKVLLVFTTLLSLLQITATAIILGVGARQQLACNKPLQMYLIIFIIRVGLSLPFAIYQHLTTVPRDNNSTRRRARRRRHNNNTPTNTADMTAADPPTTATSNQVNNENETTPSDNTPSEQQQQQRPLTLSTGWANRIKSLLDLFAILWFIVGNYLVYAPSDCTTNAAPYYYTILTFVILGYLILLIPVFLCASVIFCLPCVLVATRLFNINITSLMEGGSKEEIASIPIFRYTSNTNDDSNSTKSTQKVSNKKRKFNFFSKQQNNDDNKKYEEITIPKPEDAVCSICLCEYENNDLICKLWCDHHYHKDCVHEWLGLNSTCPLCKRDFRGKDYEEEDEEEQQY